MSSEYTSLFNAWAEWLERGEVHVPGASNFMYVRATGTSRSESNTIFIDMDNAINQLGSEHPQLHESLKAHYLKYVNKSVRERCRILSCSTKTYYVRLQRAESYVLKVIGL